MLPFLILLSAAFMLDYIEVKFGNTIPFSGLIAVMAMEIGLQKEYSVPLLASGEFNHYESGENRQF